MLTATVGTKSSRPSPAETASASEPYEIASELSANLLRVRLRGFWTDATSRRYRSELTERLNARNGRKLAILVDASDFPVQSQQVAADLRLIIDDPDLPLCRVAIVTGNALSQMQSKRIGPEHAIFADEASALAWLADV